MIDLKNGWPRWLVGIVIIGIGVLFSGQHQVLAFSGAGAGNSTSPYIITSVAELNEVRNDLDAFYRLEEDLDLASVPDWDSIGEWSEDGFEGTFDGNGHTISNLKVSGNAKYEGLFGFVEGDAVIQNVGLINVDVEGTKFVGGLAGYILEGDITNVYVTGNVAGVEGPNATSYIGGLAGYAALPTITDSYSAVTVSGDSEFGGLIGDKEVLTAVRNSYYDQTLTNVSDGGLPRTTAQMKQSSTFTNWSFSEGGEGHWGIIEGVTYPMHRTTFNQLLLDSLEVTETADGATIELNAPFASDRFVYSDRVRGDVDNITIAATPNSASTVSGTGNVALTEGLNTLGITVSSTGVSLPGTTISPFEVEYSLSIIREDGSATYPHRIRTAEQLAAIGTGEFALSDHYDLMNDIDLAGYANWMQIGSQATPFSGNFDGGHHVIYNLTITRAGENQVGLFGNLAAGGTIENVGLENADVTGGDRVGSLIGMSDGTLLNAYVKGNVIGTNTVGGLIGESSGNVTNAFFVGGVNGTADVGGLIGIRTSGTVTSAYWDSDISGLTASGGGEGKTTTEMKQQSTYIGWDFPNMWSMMDGSTYPMWKQGFEAVKLMNITVDPPTGTADWGAQSFTSEQGTYTITLDQYVSTVNIGVARADTNSVVEIDGNAGVTVTKNVSPGNNQVSIEITDVSGKVKGAYNLSIMVPAPEVIDVAIPVAGDYGRGETLTFVVTYNGDVAVSGTPHFPMVVGVTDSVYAEFIGQPAGELNKLEFEYNIPAGIQDWDGIELSTEIELPDGAGITASGEAAGLSFTAPDSSGIRIDSVNPVITLTQLPGEDTQTNGLVTVSATINDTGSGIDVMKWAEGSFTEAFFAASGTLLTEGSFEASSNGTYTVYAQDVLGNKVVQEIVVSNIFSIAPTVTLNHSPTIATNGDTVITVTTAVYGEGTGNSLSKLNWMSGSQVAAVFAGGMEGTDILTTKEFSVTTNDKYTVYALDAAGNETVKEVTISNIFTQMPALTLSHNPITNTNDSVTVTVTAAVYGEGTGNPLSKLNWMSGSQVAANFAGGTEGTDILSTKSFSVTSNGTYTVYALDAAGNETVNELTISNIVSPSSPVFETHYTVNNRADGGITLVIHPSMIDRITLKDGTIMENIELTAGIMELIREDMQGIKKSFVNLAIDDTEAAVQVQFPAESLFDILAEYPEVVFEVMLNGSSYQLQVNTLDLEHWTTQFDVPQQDLKVNVRMDQIIGSAQDQLEEIANDQGLNLIRNPVDYQVSVSADGRSREVYDFGGTYIKRAIVLDTDTTGNLIAVWFNTNTNTLHFVPGVRSAREDGTVEMMMHMPHNSIYALMKPEVKSFSDLQGHWAKTKVESLAMKLIVSGVTDNRFAPEQSITRAEFIALLVRSLGLAVDNPSADSDFVDVETNAWYAPIINAAMKAGLVQGLDSEHFAPNHPVSREQMAVLITRAIHLTGKPAAADNETEVLASFTDYELISAWARDSVAHSVSVGIISGYPDDRMAPQDSATRAEAVVMLKGFLQYINFINDDKK